MKKLLISLLLLQTFLFSNQEQPTISDKNLQSLLKYQRVLASIASLYVEEVKFEEIIDKSITGLLTELDSHSAFLDKDKFKRMNASMDGEFGGLGIVIGKKDGALTIISPIDDTPAFKVGVKSGDIIIKINDQSTLEMSLDEAVTLMRGKVGTEINITVVRKSEPKPIKFDIVRGLIKVESVSYKTYNNILYLRVSSFDRHVSTNLKKYIKQFKDKTDGIILDLRNNPGGSLTEAINTVDLFIDEGIVVSQRGRLAENEEKYFATKENTIFNKPLIILINGASASASEIVSGAIQDHKRGVLVGEETFGKGSVQIVLPIVEDNSEAIKLTIAKYYLPSGRTIQATGVKPDIQSYLGKVPQKEISEFELKEKDLKQHLESEISKISDTTENKITELKETEKKTIITKEDLLKDNQLNSGVNILKSLMLMTK